MLVRPDSILQEYLFSEEEKIAARILNPLQIAWLHNKYAQRFKEKATQIVPEATELDRSYLLKLGELEGMLAQLQELFTEHQDAQNELKKSKSQDTTFVPGILEQAAIETRASELVHKTQE